MKGSDGGQEPLYAPSKIFKSVPQIPQASTLKRTSPISSSGTGTCSIRISFQSRVTAARMVVGIVMNLSYLSN
jgi:hypothetical protein